MKQGIVIFPLTDGETKAQEVRYSKLTELECGATPVCDYNYCATVILDDIYLLEQSRKFLTLWAGESWRGEARKGHRRREHSAMTS